jgi:hypothetical protein
MRAVGLVVLMLAVFWGTNTWLLSSGMYWTWRDVQFAFALSLFFGSLVAVPLIAFLFGADFVGSRFPFPLSTLVYVAFVALGCMAYGAILHFVKGNPFPTTSEGWHFYLQGYISILATAGVLLVRRIAKSLRPTSTAK